jgi:thioester reductase-like protein
LRAERPDFDTFIRSKLIPLAGELTQANVGFSAADRQTLVDNLHVVIHCAAVVDFNEV